MVTVVAAAPMPLVAIHNICCKIWALFFVYAANPESSHLPQTQYMHVYVFIGETAQLNTDRGKGTEIGDKGAGRDLDRGTRAGTHFSVKSSLVMRLSVFVHTKECKQNKPSIQKRKKKTVATLLWLLLLQCLW